MHSLYHTIRKKENNQLHTETTGMTNAKKNTETLRKVSRWRETKQQVVASFVAVFFFFSLDWIFYMKSKQMKSFIEYYCEIWRISIYAVG